MFTGLVEGTGRIARIVEGTEEVRLQVEAPLLGPVIKGSSVSVDGVCLTAIDDTRDQIEAILSLETLACTTLGRRSVGDRVNIERPLRLGDRLGGHLVQGHVDGVGRVEEVEPAGTGSRVQISFPSDLRDLIVMKGSISVDGVSLTVADRSESSFVVALIPETLEMTHLGEYEPGREVNLEVDVVGRYIVDYLHRRIEPDAGEGITREFLARLGFQTRGTQT